MHLTSYRPPKRGAKLLPILFFRFSWISYS